MKRLTIPIAMLFASFSFLLLSSILPVKAEPELFPDVKSPVLREAVLGLAERGILKGYEDGTFQPNRVINRAEALKIAFASREDPVIPWKKPDFSDVPEDAWFYIYVQSGLQELIIKGYEDGSYRPFQDVSRAEFLKIALLADPEYLFPDLSVQRQTVKELGDIEESDWFLPFVSFVYENKLMDFGDEFQAHQGMTRAEASLVLHSIYEWKTARKAAWKKEFNQMGCEMCIHGVDFSQYAWAHWDVVKIAKSKIVIAHRDDLAERFAKGEIGIDYIYDVAYTEQLFWRMENTPLEVKLRFDQDFPEYYRRAVGLSGGRTSPSMNYMSGNESKDPIRTIYGHTMHDKGVDNSFEKHLRQVFSSQIGANPDKLDFHVWKLTDKGKEGMYDALLHTQWVDDSQLL
jgi:hypothetical protein